MKLIRKTQTCDVEVDINPGFDGFTYTIGAYDEYAKMHVIANMVDQVTAFEVIAETFNGDTYRIPAKFVIEFANHVIADLSRKVMVTQTSTTSDNEVTILSYRADGTAR